MSNQGGKRPGAGRKPLPKSLKRKAISIKLPLWLVEWMRENEKPQSKLIEEALCKKYGEIIFDDKSNNG